MLFSMAIAELSALALCVLNSTRQVRIVSVVPRLTLREAGVAQSADFEEFEERLRCRQCHLKPSVVL